jgi:low molecular weight phosphotyrosine protein phosphatase
MAEAVFRSLSASHPPTSSSPAPLIGKIDSAGTGNYHPLSPPDSRTMSTLRKHGITDYDHGARVVTEDDFRTFDYILAMDEENLRSLLNKREMAIFGIGNGAGSRTARTRGASARGSKKTGRVAQAGAEASTRDEEEWEQGTRPKLAEVRLFGDFGPHGEVHAEVGGGEVVQDPYYDGSFDVVYEQAVRFSNGFLAYLERK